MNNLSLNNLYNSKLFRDIDIALARLLARLAPNDPPAVPLAALLVSRAAGEGHVCIDLHQWAGHELKGPNESPPIGRCPDVELMDRPTSVIRNGRLVLIAIVRSCATVTVGFIFSGSTGMSSNWRNAFDSALHPLVRRCRRIKWNNCAPLLNRYFGNSPSDGSPDWQKIAAAITLLKRLCIISGAPGTGKTTTVAKFLGVLIEWTRETPLRIHLCAPTGKAAARLGASLSDASLSMDCPPSVAAALAKLEQAPSTVCSGHSPVEGRLFSMPKIHWRPMSSWWTKRRWSILS
jgi:exodeoxyribonuclease V alpha subunit